MATSYQDDYMKTALRLPRDLHADLMESARSQGRSFNAEVIARLAASLASDEEDEREMEEHLGLIRKARVGDPAEDDLVLRALELERHAIDLETQGIMLKNGSLWDVMRWWPKYGKVGLQHVDLSTAREAVDTNNRVVEEKRKESRALLERVKWFPRMWS